MGGPRISPDELEIIKNMLRRGYSQSHIARKIGRSSAIVCRYAQQLEDELRSTETTPEVTTTLTTEDRLKNINYIMTTTLTPDVKLSVIKSMVTV